ncbi:hypothetical protein J6590_047828 [Homalodisca vitripennis]|nr:hypothetical protein J6590_047828 [Homalodisca vitripennis]
MCYVYVDLCYDQAIRLYNNFKSSRAVLRRHKMRRDKTCQDMPQLPPQQKPPFLTDPNRALTGFQVKGKVLGISELMTHEEQDCRRGFHLYFAKSQINRLLRTRRLLSTGKLRPGSTSKLHC